MVRTRASCISCSSRFLSFSLYHSSTYSRTLFSGGVGWTGPTVCSCGLCRKDSLYYAQCKPWDWRVARQRTCAQLYDQCGGENWQGKTCCDCGATCVSSDKYYSQCIPEVSTITTALNGKVFTEADASAVEQSRSNGESSTASSSVHNSFFSTTSAQIAIFSGLGVVIVALIVAVVVLGVIVVKQQRASSSSSKNAPEKPPIPGIVMSKVAAWKRPSQIV